MSNFLISDEESLKENLKQRSDFRLKASDCLLRFSEEIAQHLTLAQSEDLPPKVLKTTLRLQEVLHKKIEKIHKTENKDRRKVREGTKKLEKIKAKCNFSERDMGHLKKIETPGVKTFIKKKEEEELQSEYRRFEAEIQRRLLKKQKEKIKEVQEQLEKEQEMEQNKRLKEEKKRKEEEERKRKKERERLQEQQKLEQKLEEEKPWYSSPEPEEILEPFVSPSPENVDEPPKIPDEMDLPPELESREPTPEMEPEPMLSPESSFLAEEDSVPMERFTNSPEIFSEPEEEIKKMEEEIKPKLKPIKKKKLKKPQFSQSSSFTIPNKNMGVFGDVWTQASQKKKKTKDKFSSSLLGRQQRELKRLERVTKANLKKVNTETRYVSTKKLKKKKETRL